MFAVALVCLPPAARAAGDDQETSPYINRIVFEGNRRVTSDELKGEMRTREPSFFAIFRKPRLDRATLDRDIAHLESYYRSIGFFEAKVKLARLDYSQDRRFVDVIIRIHEGEPTLVASVRFSPNSLIGKDELRKGLLLHEGTPYNSSLLDTDLYKIKVKYFERGYLAVSIQDSVRIREHRADIFYAIEPGTPIRTDRIVIEGNRDVSDKVIRKELEIHSGEVCKLDKLTETQRNLFETGLFTVVDIEPENLDPLDRTVDISIRLRERKARYIEVGFGVGNILGSRVLGEFGTRNLFGTGRTLRLKTEYAYDLFKGDNIDFKRLQFQNRYYRYDAEFQQRRIFGTKQLVSLTTFYEKDATVADVSVKTLGALISGRRRLSRYTEMLLSLSSERIRRRAFQEPEVESTSRIASASVSHDRRDYILNPRQGSYRIVTVQGAGGILGGDNDFYTVTTTFQQYHRLSRGVVFAWRLRLGFADAFGRSADTGVPVENRYFAGGGNSVRGYDENSLGPRGLESGGSGVVVPVGGRALMLTNAELRYNIPLLSRFNITGAAFVDGGNVWAALRSIKPKWFRPWADQSDVVPQDYRYSVGLGLRYNTPVGPIRVDFGYPLKVDQYTDKNGRFHINLGQIF